MPREQTQGPTPNEFPFRRALGLRRRRIADLRSSTSLREAVRIDNTPKDAGKTRVVHADAELAAFDRLPEKIRKRLAQSTIEIGASILLPYYQKLRARGMSEERAIAIIVDEVIPNTEKANAA